MNTRDIGLGENMLSRKKSISPTSSEQMFFTEREAAFLLNLSVRTLRQWRLAGDGPQFHKFGKAVRYYLKDLEHYIQAAQRQSTTVKGVE